MYRNTYQCINSMALIVIIIFWENQVDLKFENQKKINKCMGL